LARDSHTGLAAINKRKQFRQVDKKLTSHLSRPSGIKKLGARGLETPCTFKQTYYIPARTFHISDTESHKSL